jgi:valyl-tRNA synthetase
VEVATAVRRYKSEHSLPLGAELAALHLVVADAALREQLEDGTVDLQSITRAREIVAVEKGEGVVTAVIANGRIQITIQP